MEEKTMSRMTAVKYTEFSNPTLSPFCATIRATSPLVIMPTPIFRESALLKRHTLAMMPQPTILVISPTSTKHTAKSRIDIFISPIFVFNPMLTKKIGPKII